MNVATIIAIISLAVILYLAASYIYKEKKKGNACIGCPYAASCPKHRQETKCGHDSAQEILKVNHD